MSEAINVRTETWKPVPRPDWVRRINEEGQCMDIKSVVPLDENSLLRAARRNTGLQDFGADDWCEPFQVLIKSLDEEAELNLMGRLMTRSDLLQFLEARLQVEETYKRHPEIDEGEIHKLLLIIGQGRSGTSALQNMLAADPHNGTVKTWEVMFPCPPPEAATYLTDPRIAKAEKLASQVNRVIPEIQSMHEFGAEMPTESIHLECLSFMSPPWLNLLGQVPSYNVYMAKRGPLLSYQYEKRVLKLLQWKNPRQHWVMKSPAHIQHLPEVLEVYPDAWFIFTHRDPIKALSSVVSLVGTLTWARSDHLFMAGSSFEQLAQAEGSAGMLNQVIDWVESGTIPRERMCNVQYRDFIKDPLATARQIYEQCGIPLTAEGGAAMQTYMDKSPRSSRPAHRYDAGSAELIEQERRLYRRYQEYFNVPNEV